MIPTNTHTYTQTPEMVSFRMKKKKNEAFSFAAHTIVYQDSVPVSGITFQFGKLQVIALPVWQLCNRTAIHFK